MVAWLNQASRSAAHTHHTGFYFPFISKKIGRTAEPHLFSPVQTGPDEDAAAWTEIMSYTATSHQGLLVRGKESFQAHWFLEVGMV